MLWCPQPPQSIVWGKKKPSYGMTLLFVVQLLLKNFSECKQIGQIGRHELVVMIVVSTTPTFLHKYPSLPQKKKIFFFSFFALFFSSKWSFEPAPLCLPQSKNTHIYYSWNRPIPHLALARHQQKRKSFRPLLELGGEERREGHTPLN